MAADFSIQVDGLKALRKDLKALDKHVSRELTGDLKEALMPVATRANALAPRGDTGKLASRTKAFAAGHRAGLRNTLPYANPIHWGWRARGIEPDKFAVRAIDERGDQIVDDIGDAIEDHARRHGFK